MPLIIDKDNLYTAYWKARKGKEAKHEVIKYSKNLEQNILTLQKQLINGNVDVGNYRYFTIFDPKERVICAAPFPQRVLHHALMNICGPLLDKHQIPDSYASQTGKGTYAALQRARYFHKRYAWCIKIDVRKYFDNICHDVLKRQLERFFKEKRLLAVMNSIIDSYDSGTSDRGLPIGNLTSQFLANHYLSIVDHYAYEQQKVCGYVRYMDDILIYDKDKETLLTKAKMIRKKIEEELRLGLKVFDIKPTTKTMQFLGYRLTDSCLLLSQRSKARFREKVRKYEGKYNDGVWTEEDYRRHLSPLMGFVLKADSYRYRRNVLLRRF